MKPSLDGPLARVGVSEKHINSLVQGLESFYKANPYKIVVEKNAETGKCDAVIRDAVAPPLEHAIYAGMIAHNLRSALDGLACQLALLDAGRGTVDGVCGKVMFPIFLKGPRSAEKSRFWRKNNRIKPLGRFRAAIECLQPYKRGNGHTKSPLWLLHSLNNTDKHRILVVFSVATGSVGLTGAAKPIMGGRVRMFSSGGPFSIRAGVPFKDGAQVAVFDVASPSDVNMQISVKLQMHFGKGCQAVKGLPVFDTLRKIAAHVRDIVESFAPEFS